MAVIATKPTSFPATSSGIPILTGFPYVTRGTVYYVAGISGVGSDGNDGDNPNRPMLTMAEAFTRVESGDVIAFWGNITEQISTPVGIFDVTIIGLGNRPRHADAHTSNSGYSASTWKTPSSPTSTTPLLTIRQQGWRLRNILFDGPSDAAAVQLFRDGGSGDDERDASHAHIVSCKFVAGQNHIEFKGGLSQVRVEDCTLFGATADSFLETVGAGIGTNNYFEILNNRFHNNASHIDVGLNYGTICGNTFGAASGDKVDLRTGSENVVWGNYLYGTYSNVGGYYAGTNDEWGGNFNSLSGGVTAADPS